MGKLLDGAFHKYFEWCLWVCDGLMYSNCLLLYFFLFFIDEFGIKSCDPTGIPRRRNPCISSTGVVSSGSVLLCLLE